MGFSSFITTFNELFKADDQPKALSVVEDCGAVVMSLPLLTRGRMFNPGFSSLSDDTINRGSVSI